MNSIFVHYLLDRLSHGEKILDLGCGDGEMLALLQSKRGVIGYGVDISSEHVLSCIEKGLSVVQSDLDSGLQEFTDSSFDYVILSLTLQQITDPIFVLNEMLRVGNRIIITFPNFAYWKSRVDLFFGRAPQTSELPFEWHNTPNIRVVTVQDFYDLCAQQQFKVTESFGINPNPLINTFLQNRVSNLFSNYAYFVLEKW